MWVARDKDNYLSLFDIKPKRKLDRIWNNQFSTYVKIDNTLFPYLKWEDEPIEVEIIAKGRF